jgi:hypothetical protein
MLIGSKEIFGIQYEISCISKKATLYGRVALWVSGQYIGYFPEETIIHSFNHTLLAIKASPRCVRDESLLEFIETKDLETLQAKEGWCC